MRRYTCESSVVARQLGLLVLVIAASASALAQSNPVPLINQPLVPDATAPGGPDFTLTVNGTGFVSGSVVNWNGVALATTFITGSELTATVPGADIATAGTASVTVANPAPGSATSNVQFFEVRQPFGAVWFGQSVFATGMFPVAAVTADFNRDGKLDLATANDVDSTVSILLGNGDGTFQSELPYPVGTFPGEVVVGDFNGDGNLDVAVSTVYSVVSLLLGNGDGTFQPSRDTSVGNAPYALVAGDFNGDGKLDLAVCLYPNQVAILLGNGDGTFQSPVQYTVGSGGPYGVTTGDFNSDGKLDLAVAVDFDNAVAVLLGNGDGTFQGATEYATATGPHTVITADLNGDGRLDLVAKSTGCGGSGAAVSVLLGNGDGTFQGHIDYPTQKDTVLMAVGDLNGDGKLDLVVPYIDGRTLTVFLGNGDGTFRGPSYFVTGNEPLGVAFGDFNGDGMLDLAVANAMDNTVSVLTQATSVLSKTFVNFGTVRIGSTSHSFKVTLSNIGSASFTIARITLGGKNPTDFSEDNNCPSSLAPGASCSLQLAFKPLVAGQLAAIVTIADSAVNQPQTIALQGTGD